jgi:hypothetical protein
MILISNKSLTCADCGEVVTPAQMKKDEMRIHKYNDSFYCELCYENLKEQIYDSLD